MYPVTTFRYVLYVKGQKIVVYHKIANKYTRAGKTSVWLRQAKTSFFSE